MALAPAARTSRREKPATPANAAECKAGRLLAREHDDVNGASRHIAAGVEGRQRGDGTQDAQSPVVGACQRDRVGVGACRNGACTRNGSQKSAFLLPLAPDTTACTERHQCQELPQLC